MPDVLLDGLPVLDLLEINPNTHAVARFTQRDQSSVSRIYRQVSHRLGLGFRKRAQGGGYQAQTNQALLEHLRRASQAVRLQADPPQPRWLLCSDRADLQALLTLEAPPLPASLQPIDCSDAALGRLLRQRLLDLAVCSPSAEGCRHQPGPGRGAPEGQAQHSCTLEADLQELTIGTSRVLLLRDQRDHPGVAALISTLRERLHEG